MATIGAVDWIISTLSVVDFSHFFKGRVIVFAVLTGVRSLGTLLSLMGGDVATLKPLPTLMHTFYLHKLASSQLTLRGRISVQMLFIFPKLSPPITTLLFVRAPNFKLFQGSL